MPARKYELSEGAKKQCLQKTAHGDFFDWHLWADSLGKSERALLESEVFGTSSLRDLSMFAKQYYRFVANNREDPRLRELEREFIEAQIDGSPQEKVEEVEQKHFLLTREIMQAGRKERS